MCHSIAMALGRDEDVQTKPDDRTTIKKVEEIMPDGPLDNVAKMN